tara:strand:- start:57 stop:470 length:414 start_codon:yes stop_codon:yes gene_type:complete
MPQFKVTYADGTVKTHLATLERVQEYVKHGGSYEEENSEIVLSENEIKEKARSWRNSALRETDKFVSVTDHPDHAKIIAYRSALRAWPEDTENFPDKRPVLKEDSSETDEPLTASECSEKYGDGSDGWKAWKERNGL